MRPGLMDTRTQKQSSLCPRREGRCARSPASHPRECLSAVTRLSSDPGHSRHGRPGLFLRQCVPRSAPLPVRGRAGGRPAHRGEVRAVLEPTVAAPWRAPQTLGRQNPQGHTSGSINRHSQQRPAETCDLLTQTSIHTSGFPAESRLANSSAQLAKEWRGDSKGQGDRRGTQAASRPSPCAALHTPRDSRLPRHLTASLDSLGLGQGSPCAWPPPSITCVPESVCPAEAGRSRPC